MKIKKIDIYILGLCIINMVQSILTPIIEDEAYYWMFSQNLDVGYFDHPPMVAFMIKLGCYLFSGTLGVRFMTILLFGLTTKMMWELIPTLKKKHPYAELVFFGILLSSPILHVYGLISTPDAPLLCFSTLFLLSIKRIREQASFVNILMFGAAAALLVYSKYHGGIIILLGVVFQLDLLKKRSTYIAGFIALILISPHIYWQYQHDFITFNYHLFQRTSGSFNIENVWHYTSSTFGILNPGLIILLCIHLKKNPTFRKENKFLLRMFWGFLIFFFFYSFRSRIEAHWVAFSVIPLSILIYNLSVSHPIINKQLKYISIISILLICAVRVLLILDIPIDTEVHKEKKAYFLAIAALANGKKVVFNNSYQKASKYYFYTGEASFSDNNVYYRKNQYDLLDAEKTFNDKQVLFVGGWSPPFCDSLRLPCGELLLYKVVDHYPIFNKLKASLTNDDLHTLTVTGKMDLTIHNPYTYTIDLAQQGLPYQLQFCLIKGHEKFFVPLQIDSVQQLKPNTNTKMTIRWDSNDIRPGTYTLQIVMNAGYLYPKVISKKYKVQLKTIANKE